MKRIETPRLVIRNHVPEDAGPLYDYLSLPEIYKFEPGSPVSRAEAETLIGERMKTDDFLAVAEKESGRLAGHLWFHHGEPLQFMTWELGFIFNPAYQNRGYCSEASAAVIGYAFSELNAHKVVAFCNPENTASRRVLEKIGMEREGLFRQKGFFRKDENGNPLWHDACAYGKLSG